MKLGVIFALFLSRLLCAHAGQSHQENAQKCSDGLCPLPVSGEATHSVVSPVPETAIEPMAAAPRLKSLNGKTIALVGGSFMANVTHPELKRLILAEFPTAKVYLLSEIGSAGPWPRPGVVRRAFRSGLGRSPTTGATQAVHSTRTGIRYGCTNAA